MMAVQPNTQADYALLWRNVNGVTRFFSHEGRETSPRKLVDHKTFELVQFELKRGIYDGLAFIKNGEPVGFTSVGEAPEAATTKVDDKAKPKAVPKQPKAQAAPAASTAEDFADLPDQMVQAKRWLVWKSEPNPEPRKKPRKVPYYANGSKRSGETDSPADVANFATFDDALAALQKGQYTGLGFALGSDGTGSYWQGIDLDDLPNRPELQPIADSLPGYTERSPSGTGMHAIGYGKPFATLGSNGTGVEAYSSGRYFTVTADGAGLHDPCDLTAFVLSHLHPVHDRGKAATSAIEAERVETVAPQTVTELRSALFSMSSDGRDLWVKIGHSLKTLGKVGRGLWLEWSATSEKFDAAGAARTWNSFRPNNTGYQAVFAEAQRQGWVNPLSNDATGGAGGVSSGFGGASPSPSTENATGAAPESWPEPIDPFVEHPAPRFPVDHLPEAMAKYCHELAEGSGFDVGGYGFALLIAASNIIDHRARLAIGPMSVPPFLWGGLVDMSGGGKSPIMAAGLKFAQRIDQELIHESTEARKQFIKDNPGKSNKEFAELPQPPWKQLIANDTTVEALGELLKDNPTGMLIAPDELSAFVGQMDAYNKGSGKDRAAYLQMFDGGSKTINRKSALMPCVVENFSVGVLSGVQPEKLTEMFKKGGADGLFQRFLVYSLRRPGNVNYSALIGTFTESNVAQIFEQLHTWTKQGIHVRSFNVNESVQHLMESYHQHVRMVALRTPDGRLREHLNKFPGFLARVLFALHFIECAAAGRLRDTIDVETFNRAHAIAGVLFRHSEAVYEVVESRGSCAMRLMKTACEAILSKGWHKFKRGDLTTTATGWREARAQEALQADAALDLLIELGWIKEETPKPQTGKAGRRSSGAFVVNPLALTQFVDRAKRIVNERAERFKAIQKVAPTRVSNPWE